MSMYRADDLEAHVADEGRRRCLKCSRMLPFGAFLQAGKGRMRTCAECWRKKRIARRWGEKARRGGE